MREFSTTGMTPQGVAEFWMEKMIPRLRNISLMTEKELKNLSMLGQTDKDSVSFGKRTKAE